MKAIVVASLLLAAASRAIVGEAQVTSDDPECLYCNDASFLFAAQDALNDCPGQLRILQSRLSSATTDQAVDLAWNYFCTGSCPANIQKIDDDHACCLGEHGPMALNIRHGCTRSSTGRYCGAEVSNLRKVNCTAPDSASCTQKTNCQWDEAAQSCYFNGDRATINSICSTCNHQYFSNFFGGGIFTPQEHAVQASQYATFCTVQNATSCYAVAAGVGFRLPDALSTTDVSNRICTNTATARLAKMCMRSNSARVGEAIRRSAVDAYINCNETIDQCKISLNEGFNRAAAIDASARRVCVTDSSGSFCAARVASAFSTVAGQCMEDTIRNGTCDGSCPTTSRNAINSLGCCAASYGYNGFADARTSLSTAALSQFGLGLSRFNHTLEAQRNPTANSPAVPSNAEYKSLRDNAISFIATNDGLGPVRSCGAVGTDSPSNECAASAATRTYEFELALVYSVVNTNQAKDYLFSAFAVDAASALGVATSQITSVTARASGLKVRINAENYPATIVTVTVSGDSDADNQASDDAIVALNRAKSMIFPVFGVEIALNCPKAYRYGYQSFFNGAYAISKNGDSALSAAAQADSQTRNHGSGGDDDGTSTEANSVLSKSVMGAGIALALCVLCVFV